MDLKQRFVDIETPALDIVDVLMAGQAGEDCVHFSKNGAPFDMYGLAEQFVIAAIGRVCATL